MKNNSIDIVYKNECTGCSVCYEICPHNAIEIKETSYGFHYPIVNEKECTNCGLCVIKCHALNYNFKSEFKQKIYDVRADDETRMKSSSGGMFTLAANYVLENNGYVCGASFTDDWLGVEHIIINDKKDLNKLRGSKYIESNLGTTFKEIKKLLNDKKLVLFSGVPCQVSALNLYLGKDYDNLITIDLLCNSVVPQKIWKKYLKEKFTDGEIKEIEYISFRDKEKFGWGAGIFFKIKDKEYIENSSLYMQLFYEHVSVKEECLHCKYSKFERYSDITIGDFWGTENYDNKGVSLVFINSIKGNNIFDKIKIKSEYKLFSEYKYTNGGLGIINYPIFYNRKYFFDNLDKESLEELYKNSGNPKHNVAIVNMMFHPNFGGVITYYALFNVIKNLGYNPILIYNKFRSNSLYENIKGCQIGLKYLNVGNDIFSKEELSKFVEKCDTFLVGSDQVWRNEIVFNNVFYYLLDFVPNTKKKISYSSSFGLNRYDGDNISKVLFKYYINQFDNISVREDIGVSICKDEFNIAATHLLDPVMLLNDYDYLISKSNLNVDYDYIAVYALGKSKMILKLLDIYSTKLNMKYLIIDNEDENYSIEDWLYIIKNSKYFITDSFHGICFSIIFNKPFVAVLNEGPQSRILSIARQFNIENRIIKNINDITLEKIDSLIYMDFKEINEKLELEKQKSLEWLKNALEKPKKIKEDSYICDMINLLIEENKKLNSKIEENNIIFNNKLEETNIYFNNKLKENYNWIKLFGIYNNKNYIYIYFFGIKCTIRATEKNINRIAWWMPIKKWRDNFRKQFI